MPEAGHDNAKAMLPDQKLNALVARHATLERDLAAAIPTETYVKLSREFAELAPVVEAVKSYRAAEHELAGVTTLLVCGLETAVCVLSVPARVACRASAGARNSLVRHAFDSWPG